VAEAGVKDWGARGGPFIGAWGRGGARGGVHRRASTAGMVAHRGDDKTARAGEVTGGSAGAKGQRRKAPTGQASE
jgi:hypothetical protein